MKRAVLITLGAALLAAPVQAQSSGNLAVRTAGQNWAMLAGYITTAAEEASDSLYAYRPTPGVRSFGQLIAHVAGAHYLFCAAATNQPMRAEDDIEKRETTKAGIVAALKESIAYCEKAYAQSDADAAAPTELFGRATTRMAALITNASHDGEHYGNLVTYMRMNGIVPPSSRGQ